MSRGKKLHCPRIILVPAKQPKYSSRDEMWTVVGPILARVLAQVILQEKRSDPGS